MKQGQTEDGRGLVVGTALIGVAGGLYFALVGAGVLPPPGRAHGPGWVVAAVGIGFLFAGVAILAQQAGGANAQGELPRDAPAWTHVVQHVAVLVVTACLAATGTWIALAGEAEQFSSNVPLTSWSGGVMLMRTAFGIGAIITWLFFLALAKRSLRLLLGKTAAR
jgi:hypothetical protein